MTLLGGKYEIVREIGRGGTATVYEAVHRISRKAVALKLLHVDDPSEGGLEARFQEEARSAAWLAHPNIVAVYDFGRDEQTGVLYLAQALIRGEHLGKYLAQRGPIPVDDAWEIFAPLMDALFVAHRCGVAHRDVKPANVMMAETDAGIVPTLVDFGLAKVFGEQGSGVRTPTGMMLGTPAYMSPERVRGVRDTGRGADLWAIAVCLYEAITGQLPFPGSTVVAVAARILEGRFTPPTQHVPSLPATVDRFFVRAFAADPDERYPAVDQLAQWFQWSIAGGDDMAEATVDDAGSLRLRVGIPVAHEDAGIESSDAVRRELGSGSVVMRYRTYRELVDAMVAGRLDVAWLPPVAYVHARAHKAADLLLGVERDGGTSYGSVLLARRGAVPYLKAMKKARAVWVDPWSAAGYLVPRAMMRDAGVSLAEALASEEIVGSYEAVLAALRAGTADVGPAYCSLDAEGRPAARSWQPDDPVEILAVSAPIPTDVLCVGAKMSAGVRGWLKATLKKLPEGAPILRLLGGTAFVDVEDAAYDALEVELLLDS